MKKVLLSLFTVFIFGLAATAQTEQGNWLVGGNLNLNTSENNSNISFSPSAGYFFVENFAVGANLNVSSSKFGNTKTTSFGIGPFARYYFGTMNLRPFAHADFGYQTNKTKNITTATFNSTNYFLGAGLAAFINRNVAIEGLAGYSHTAIQNLDGSGGFNLRVGFQVYLSKRQVEELTK